MYQRLVCTHIIIMVNITKHCLSEVIYRPDPGTSDLGHLGHSIYTECAQTASVSVTGKMS